MLALSATRANNMKFINMFSNLPAWAAFAVWTAATSLGYKAIEVSGGKIQLTYGGCVKHEFPYNGNYIEQYGAISKFFKHCGVTLKDPNWIKQESVACLKKHTRKHFLRNGVVKVFGKYYVKCERKRKSELNK